MEALAPIGEAIIKEHADGSRTVEHADPMIRVSAELLANLRPDVAEPDGTLVLDTAGEYRYRFAWAEDERHHIYERR